MKNLRLICVLIVLAALAVGQAAKPSEYTALVAKTNAGDLKVDFKQMRLAYMESPERLQKKDTDKEEDAMLAALDGKDLAAALKNADAVLANEYVNIDAHFVAFVANRDLHNDERAAFHRAVFRGLVDSIIGSGDGKSTKTAMVVISVREEYVVLRVLGLTPYKQRVLHEGGRDYDVMEVKDKKTGESVTRYFDVTIPFKYYLK
jgi:hypothetical protein